MHNDADLIRRRAAKWTAATKAGDVATVLSSMSEDGAWRLAHEANLLSPAEIAK